MNIYGSMFILANKYIGKGKCGENKPQIKKGGSLMKTLTILCTLVLAVALIAPVYAEVQNVKVSGDISIYGAFRDEYGTTGSGSGRTINGAATSDGFPAGQSWDYYATITRLRIDADLTDNVSTLVRLINERDWDVPAGAAADQIDLDLASITLKEMLYSPLTLVLGRQDIRWGSGLVIGDGTTGATASTLTASDLSYRKAFDAIRALLDYDPWTLDIIIAKVTESGDSATPGRDIDVYGVDASYKFAEYNAVFEAYYVAIHDSSLAAAAAESSTDTSTLGARLTGEPTANLTGEIEFAYQFGDSQAASNIDQEAWAFDIGAVYAFQTSYSPKLGLKYGLRTGQDTAAAATADNEAWNAVLEDQVNGEIFDPNTNIQFVKLSGSLVPVEKLTAGIDYYIYWFAEDRAFPSVGATAVSADDDAGSEVDITLKYAYTEDVTIGLVAAWFFPGDAYGGSTNVPGTIGGDETATEILATVTVAF